MPCTCPLTISSSDPRSVLIPELLEEINGIDTSFRVEYFIDINSLQMTSGLLSIAKINLCDER